MMKLSWGAEEKRYHRTNKLLGYLVMARKKHVIAKSKDKEQRDEERRALTTETQALDRMIVAK